MLDPEKYRKDIRGYGDKIFLNSAGASLAPDIVNHRIKDYLDREATVGGYRAAELFEDELGKFYSEAAQLIGARAENIAFTHNATDAYGKALTSLPFRKNDLIITTDDDYASNQLQFISLAHRYGIEVKRIRTKENGDLDIDYFESMINKKRPALVAVTHIPTNSGLVQDVEAVGRICRSHDLVYLVDACQSVGQIPVDVRKMGCDYLSTTGRKFLRGPRGTGFLYVSDRILEKGCHPLLIDGRGAVWTEEDSYSLIDSARRFENWEVPYALVAGLTEALRYVNSIGMPAIEEYNRALVSRFRSRLQRVPDLDVLDRGSQMCNIITFRKRNRTLEQVGERLLSEKVCFSTSSLAWGLLDFQRKGVDGAIRLSPHYFNTIEETDRVADIIESI